MNSKTEKDETRINQSTLLNCEEYFDEEWRSFDRFIIRITIDRVCDEARILRSLVDNLWNQAKGCSNNKDRSSLEINNFIDALFNGQKTITLYNRLNFKLLCYFNRYV